MQVTSVAAAGAGMGACEWTAGSRLQRLFRGPTTSGRFETTQLEAAACSQEASP